VVIFSCGSLGPIIIFGTQNSRFTMTLHQDWKLNTMEVEMKTLCFRKWLKKESDWISA
jgi:hypothetical protein